MPAFVFRNPVATVAVAAAVRSLIDAIDFVNPDTNLFAAAGRRLLFEGDLYVFRDAVIQVGPLHLLYSGALGRLGTALGLTQKFFIVVVSEIVFSVVAVLCLRVMLRTRQRQDPQAEVIVGAIVALLGPAWLVGTSGHPAEGFIALAWVGIVILVRKGRSVAGGAVLGLAAGAKLWAILGAPLLSLRKSHRGSARSALAFAGVAVAVYAPFFVWGEVRTFEYTWDLEGQSPLAYFWDPGAAVPWGFRVAQGFFVAIVGLGFAMLFRDRIDADWAVPAVVVAARLLVDPKGYPYYWVAIGTLLLLGIGTQLHRVPQLLYPLIAVGFCVTLVPFYFLGELGYRTYLTVACGLVLVGGALVLRSSARLIDAGMTRV